MKKILNKIMEGVKSLLMFIAFYIVLKLVLYPFKDEKGQAHDEAIYQGTKNVIGILVDRNFKRSNSVVDIKQSELESLLKVIKSCRDSLQSDSVKVDSEMDSVLYINSLE